MGGILHCAMHSTGQPLGLHTCSDSGRTGIIFDSREKVSGDVRRVPITRSSVMPLSVVLSGEALLLSV